MSFAPYLGFPGTCREAMTRYAEIFGATDLQVMTWRDAPPGAMPEGEDQDHVMHAQFTAGPGAPLMGADTPQGASSPAPGGGAAVFHGAPDLGRAREVFEALAEGGHVVLPFGRVFWSEGFGMVEDRWGTRWIVTVATPLDAEAATAGASS
jgi:PhnB protein